jgi:hypothetical protein
MPASGSVLSCGRMSRNAAASPPVRSESSATAASRSAIDRMRGQRSGAENCSRPVRVRSPESSIDTPARTPPRKSLDRRKSRSRSASMAGTQSPGAHARAVSWSAIVCSPARVLRLPPSAVVAGADGGTAVEGVVSGVDGVIECGAGLVVS